MHSSTGVIIKHNNFSTEVIEPKKKVKIDFIAKTDEEYASFSYGCSGFFDSFKFVIENLDRLVKQMKDEDVILTKKTIGRQVGTF